MAELRSNLDAVCAQLDALVQSFNFTRPGKDQSLGRDLAIVVAGGIHERSVPGRLAPDGAEWHPNEPGYGVYKQVKYDADQPNVRTGQMLSLLSLMGTTSVGPDYVDMKYGIDAPPTSALGGTTLTKGDLAVTDIEKAGWCTDQGRPFYGLDDTIASAVRAEAAEALTDHLREG